MIIVVSNPILPQIRVQIFNNRKPPKSLYRSTWIPLIKDLGSCTGHFLCFKTNHVFLFQEFFYCPVRFFYFIRLYCRTKTWYCWRYTSKESLVGIQAICPCYHLTPIHIKYYFIINYWKKCANSGSNLQSKKKKGKEYCMCTLNPKSKIYFINKIW